MALSKENEMYKHELPSPTKCTGCGVTPNQVHEDGCGVARCRYSGYQYISCWDSEDHECKPDKHTGWWPGELECYEYGLYTDANSIWGLGPDLNTLVSKAIWSVEDQRFYLHV